MGEFHQPAEHLINGKRYPLEFQVYFEQDLEPVPVPEPKKDKDGKAIVEKKKEKKAEPKKAAEPLKDKDGNVIPACDAKKNCSGNGTTSDANSADGCVCACTKGFTGADCSVPPPKAGDWNWTMPKPMAAVGIMFEENDCRINTFDDCKLLLKNVKKADWASKVFDLKEFKACESKTTS